VHTHKQGCNNKRSHLVDPSSPAHMSERLCRIWVNSVWCQAASLGADVRKNL